MQRSIINTLLGLSLATASAATFAEDWKFLPVRDASYKPDVTLSIVAGQLNGTPRGSGNYTGVDVTFNCLLLQPPSGVIRTNFSVGKFDHNGLKLTTFEHLALWTMDIDKNLTFGIGPGVADVKAEIAGKTTNMAAFQIGTELNYRMGSLNLGLGARWQDTRKKDIAPGVQGANNTLVQAKVGYNF